MNGYAEAFFPPAPSYPIVDRLTDGPAVVDLRQMAPLRLFAAQTHQQASRCPRSANGVRPFALPLAYAPCSLISRPPAASSSSSVPHGSRLNFSVPALGSDHAIPLSLPPDHGRRNPPSPCFSQGGSSTASPSLYRILRAAVLPLAPVSTVDHSPRPFPLRLTDQSNRLAPFKPVRLLHAPLAASPDLSLLPLAPVSTVDFAPRPIPLQLTDQPNRLAPPQGCPPALCSPLQHPPGSCLAACSGLYRRFCSPPLPAAAHKSVKPTRSPSSPSACSVLPSAAHPAIAVSAPRFPLQHSPTTISRSPLATFRGPSPPNLTAPLHFLSTEPRTSRTARDPVSLSLTATFQQIADVPVCRPSQHSTAILRASRAKPDLSATRASPSSSAPRVHGSTFHLPLDLLPSTPPLASVRSDRQDRAPRSLIEHIRHTAAAASSFHLSQHRRPARHALPSASSPM